MTATMMATMMVTAHNDGQGITDLPGPPSVQATCKKINTLKRHTQEITRDQRSQDDTQISYLETLEEQDNLTLAQMLAR
jgi:hypothetical protein